MSEMVDVKVDSCIGSDRQLSTMAPAHASSSALNYSSINNPKYASSLSC